MKHTPCQSLLDGVFREELVEVPDPPHPGSQADPVAGILSVFQKLAELQNVGVFLFWGRGEGCHKKMDTSLSYSPTGTNDILVPCIGKAVALRAGKPGLDLGTEHITPGSSVLL